MMISTRLRVKELLRERRWTTKVLAEKTGMSESYLTHIKNGTRRWNEDALKKLARAFDLEPTDLFSHRRSRTDDVDDKIDMSDQQKKELKIKLVPVMSEIPSHPSGYNNQVLQGATGYRNEFIPVSGKDDDSMFCLYINDNTMAPQYVKGDYLIVSPETGTKSGDVVAVEYGPESNKAKAIMKVNYMDEFIVLDSFNRKGAPVALVKGKDDFRIIGKLIYRYQKMA